MKKLFIILLLSLVGLGLSGCTTPLASDSVGGDFNTFTDGGIVPRQLWSDGTTMWMLGFNNSTSNSDIYAYNLETKNRDISQDFSIFDAGK